MIDAFFHRAGSGSTHHRRDRHAKGVLLAQNSELVNRTIIEAFTAQPAALGTREPTPQTARRLPKHVRYLCATPRRVRA